MSRGQARKARERMARLDSEYRQALGVEPAQQLPSKIGAADTSGAARGGRGASRKGRGRRK